ncbi:MAG: hypothetical protein ISS35_08820 [Kiritimatiellae bacterium]|nr:hypothetical protein [Kiritimatiellia bacterium]
MRRIGQFLALARLTTLEAMRQPVCLLLATGAVLATALTPVLTLHNLGEAGRLARDSGLAFHLFFGLFLAGYASCVSLSRELRRGTAAAVLSKPVGRGLFFSAKFAGVAMLVMMYSVCTCIATLLAERCAERFLNTERILGYVTDWRTAVLLLTVPGLAFLVGGVFHYLKRGAFQSSAFVALILGLLLLLGFAGCFDQAGHWAPYHTHVQWRIVPASVLVTFALLMFSALALTLSTRLTLVPTMTLCVAIFCLGLMSDYWFGIHTEAFAGAHLLHNIIPNWQHFWAADFLANEGHIPARLLTMTTLYATAVTTTLLCIGAALFNKTEVR